MQRWRLGVSNESSLSHVSDTKKLGLLPGPAVVVVPVGAAFLQDAVC